MPIIIRYAYSNANVSELDSPRLAGARRRRADAFFTAMVTRESISLPESHRGLGGTGLGRTRTSSSVSLSLLVGGKLDSSLSGGTTLFILNTSSIGTSSKSAHDMGWVKVLCILLFLCRTFTDPSDNDRLPFNLFSLLASTRAHFKSDGDKDFFLEFRLFTLRFCLLESLAACIVAALARSGNIKKIM